MGAWISADEDPAPLILRTLVNGREGFTVLPQSEDDDDLIFENWETLTAWISALAGQIVDVNPQDVESYDDWLDNQ